VKLPGNMRERTPLESDAMTPMIDVVFLLLVFFVCASVGQSPDSFLPADLKGNTASEIQPVPQDEPDWDRPTIRIRIDAHADANLVIRLNDAVVDGFEDLQQRLEQLAVTAPDAHVILDINDDTAVQVFVAVYDMCQSLALTDISFATNGNP
jgi:biopolymer transport protein ExbD